MANKTIYGCVKWADGKVYFEGEACDSSDYTGCINWTGEHAGMVAVTISEINCDDTYYGCVNWATGKFQLIIPDDCCDNPPSGTDMNCYLGDEWNESGYERGAVVEHSGTYYVALEDTMEEPPHADWKSLSPWGGAGNTPKYMEVTFSGVTLKDGESWPGGHNLNGTWYPYYQGDDCSWESITGSDGLHIDMVSCGGGFMQLIAWAQNPTRVAFSANRNWECHVHNFTHDCFDEWFEEEEWISNRDGTITIGPA